MRMTRMFGGFGALAVLLSCALLWTGTRASAQEPHYQGMPGMRGLYVATDRPAGPVVSDYLIARDLVLAQRANDGRPIHVTRFDFAPIHDLPPFRHFALLSGHGEMLMGEVPNFPASNLSDLGPAARDMLLRDQAEVIGRLAKWGSAEGEEVGTLSSAILNMNFEAVSMVARPDPGRAADKMNAEVVVLSTSVGIGGVDFTDGRFEELLICETREFTSPIQITVFTPEGPDCRHYTRVTSLANLVADTPTLDLLRMDFDQDIALLVSGVSFVGGKIIVQAAAYDRQVPEQGGFAGWDAWFDRVSSVGQARGPSVTCALAAEDAARLDGLDQGTVLLVRVSPVTLTPTSATFDCRPAEG